MGRKPLQYILVAIATACTLNVCGQLSGYYQEDFEGTFPPAGWQVQNVLDSAYTWSQSPIAHYSGTHSAYIHYSSNDSTQGEDWLILPQFMVADNDSFSFWLAPHFVPFPPDSTVILVSATDSAISSFSTVLATLSQGNNYPGTQNTFKHYKYSLSGFAGQNIYVAIRNRNLDGDGIFVDLVRIGNPLKNQDAVAVSIDVLDNVSTVSSLIPKATVKNNSFTEQSFSVTMTISGGYSSTKDVTNLASAALQQVDFDPYTPVAGDVMVSVQTQLPGDEDPGNDTLSKVIAAFDPLSGFYQEDFEDTFPPLGWQVKDVLNQPNTWMQDNSSSYSGNSSAFLHYSPYGVQGEDWLILPQFTVAATDSFSFWLALPNTGDPPDSTYIMVSSTDTYLSGFTNVLGVLSEGDNYPIAELTYQYYSFSLADYAGQNIYVAFKNRNIWGDGIYVDLVTIGTPLVLNATAISIDLPAYISTDVLSPMATVQNNSNQAASFSVTLNATGGYTSTKDVINLAVGATQQVTFDPWSPIIGNATMSLTTELPGDSYPDDDSISKVVIVLDTFINYGWTIKPDALYPAHDIALASVNHPNGSSALYMLGGYDGINILPDANKFDPSTNFWSSLNSMPMANYASSAAAINDKIYLIGGYNPIFNAIGDNQIYDIATGSWSNGSPMPTSVGEYAFGVYHDSLLYYFGGYDIYTGNDNDLVQIYDPVTDSWTNGTSVPAAGFAWQAGIVGNKIVLSGGASTPFYVITPTTYVGTIDASNPANITWVQVDDFPAGGVIHQGSGNSIDPLSGLAVFAGGNPTASGTTPLSITLAYDLNSNTWKIGPDKPTAANNLRNLACVVYNDSMYMASLGGFDGSSELKVNEWLNLGPAPLATGNNENHLLNFDLSSYPNPFSKVASIYFSLDHSSAVRISIVDVMGKEVGELCNKILPAGRQEIMWNASGYADGVYFCKVNVNGNVVNQKLVKLN